MEHYFIKEEGSNAPKFLCTQMHPICQNLHSPPLPTRVLDVGTSSEHDSLKLYVTEGAKVPFAALSYCWGAPQPMMTTTKNISSYLSSIDILTLPKSIQDAIHVTRELGLRYLWIDSLCILQDSPDDKAKEISQMRHVFRDAFVTILAASATNCNAGFLNRETEPVERSDTIPYITPNGERGTMLRAPWTTSSDHDPENDPVNRRAWIFQERLLASRLLIYPAAPYPLQWQCQGMRRSNGGKVVSLDKTGFEKLPPEFFLPKSTDSPPDKGEARNDLWELWSSLLSNYTARDLTVGSDKLPAISGIAEEFQNVWGGEYLAGIWSHQLIRSLLWRLFPTKPASGVKQIAYRAPSWSWASIDEHIVHALTKLPAIPYRFRVINCHVTPALKTAPFGQVIDGVLVVSGLLKEATWAVRRRQLFDAENDPDEKREIGKGHPDEESQMPGGKGKVWCLPLLDPNRYERYVPTGLLLREAGDEKFRRVGIFILGKLDWFDESLEQEIVII